MLRALGENASEWELHANAYAATRKHELSRSSIKACCNGNVASVGSSTTDRRFKCKWGAPNEPELLEGEVWYDIVLPPPYMCGTKIKRDRDVFEETRQFDTLVLE